MKYLSVCSGIEAASVAWEQLNWEPVGFSEIEPFPSAVLAHRFPNVRNFGDMTLFEEWEIERGTTDALVGGTPCQSFSVAGLRAGLEDPRGNLMLVYGAIAAHLRTPWFIWENVPGVLSSNGGFDFASFLGLLTGRKVGVPEGGWRNSGILAGIPDAYGLAWTSLDAQYFGVPQRRERVFVVGYLGDWRRAAAVLLESESLQGHSPPSRETGQDVTGSLASRSSAGGGLGTDFDLGGGIQISPSLRDQPNPSHRLDSDAYVAVAGTLNANGKAAGSDTQQDAESGLLVLDARGNGNGNDVNTLTGDHASRPTDYTPLIFSIQERAVSENINAGPQGKGFQQDIAYTLEARHHAQAVAMTFLAKGGSGRMDAESETFVTHALRGEGFDASEDGTGQGTPLTVDTFTRYDKSEVLDIASTQERNPRKILRTLRNEIGKEAFAQWKSRVSDSLQSPEVLRAFLHERRFRCSSGERESIMGYGASSFSENGTAWTMQKMWSRECFRCASYRWRLDKQFPNEPDENLPKLPSEGTQQKAKLSSVWRTPEGVRLLLEASSEIQKIWRRKGNEEKSTFTSGVRRLLPVETERLQGFPDNWTKIPTWNGWRNLGIDETPEALREEGLEVRLSKSGKWRVKDADGPRYRAIGNSMHTGTMLWIGRRIHREQYGDDPGAVIDFDALTALRSHATP